MKSPSFLKRLPTKFFPDLILVGARPAACDNEASLVLDGFKEAGEFLGTLVKEDVTILQVRAHMHFIGEVENLPGDH